MFHYGIRKFLIIWKKYGLIWFTHHYSEMLGNWMKQFTNFLNGTPMVLLNCAHIFLKTSILKFMFQRESDLLMLLFIYIFIYVFII